MNDSRLDSILSLSPSVGSYAIGCWSENECFKYFYNELNNLNAILVVVFFHLLFSLCAQLFSLVSFPFTGTPRFTCAKEHKYRNIHFDRLKSDYSSTNHNNCQFVRICFALFYCLKYEKFVKTKQLRRFTFKRGIGATATKMYMKTAMILFRSDPQTLYKVLASA